ncbi:MAG: hypothetical protein IJX28_01815 [Clostridia bacterium]|nr:hypothetical protein [Clostridia bacterium]
MRKGFAKGCLALVLAMLLPLALTSCNNTETGEVIPEGMKIANCEGDDFRLYVPTDWNENTAYGIAGAYYNLDVQSTVSVVKYLITEEMNAALPAKGDAAALRQRLEAFSLQYCRPAISEQPLVSGLKVEEDEDASEVLLDQLVAHRAHYLVTVDGQNLHYLQVIGEKNSAFYVFTYTAHPDLYEALLPSVERMLEEFIFADPYLPDEYPRLPAEEGTPIPAGMAVVSNADVDFHFYVPVTWEVEYKQEIYSAYLASDRSNVSVIPYVPDRAMSVIDFFELCKNEMVKVGGEGSFTLLSQEEVTLGGRAAMSYVYTYRVGETVYQYRQVIAAYKSMMYSLTYTATPENFESHMADVDAMIGAFVFR